MSIGPVQNYISVIEAAPANAQPRPRPQAQSRAADPSQNIPPNAGRVSKQEVPVLKHVPAEAQMPEDEVQLQRDSELQNELIVRYVDGSGYLILQVPAEQVLKFKRAIAAEFDKANRPATEGTNQEGESHGH